MEEAKKEFAPRPDRGPRGGRPPPKGFAICVDKMDYRVV